MHSQKTLTEYMLDAIRLYSQKPAISFIRNGEIKATYSYRELEFYIRRVVGLLIDSGIKKGDRIILCMEKSHVFVISHLACQMIGVITVPLNPGFKESEMDFLINNIEAALVIAESSKRLIINKIQPFLKILCVNTATEDFESLFTHEPIEKLPAFYVNTGDPALILYTSGTTGHPKGAVLNQGNLAQDAQSIIDIWEIRHTDTLCHALPLFHTHGLCFALHTSLIAGAHVLLLDHFSPQIVLQVLSNTQEQNRCSIFMAVPAMYQKMLRCLGKNEAEFVFDHVRLWTSGSAPLLEKDFLRIKKQFGKEPVEREGMTETGMNFSNPLHGKRKPGSIGVPLPNLKVRIVGTDDFQDVKPGELGEIWLKGPSITKGYWRNLKETARAFSNGWFKTGDLGKVDDEGYFFLTDRLKNIIISGGENISPKEIEFIINSIEDVEESVVVGIPDETWGEMVVAAVIKKHGSQIMEQQIIITCKRHLHDWKCPKKIIFLNEIPKNTMGKVILNEVRNIFFNHQKKFKIADAVKQKERR